ncbi:MAG: hypothetical protein QXM38_03355 [Candidatus Aenigmatarchaeota archaeon]
MKEFELEGELMKKEEYVCVLPLTQDLLPQYQVMRKVVYELKIGEELFSFELPFDLGAEEKSKVKIKVKTGVLLNNYSIVYKGREVSAILLSNIYFRSRKK